MQMLPLPAEEMHKTFHFAKLYIDNNLHHDLE